MEEVEEMEEMEEMKEMKHTLRVFLSHGIKRDMSLTVSFAGFMSSVFKSGAGKATTRPI